MNVLIAMDSFKGALSSERAGKALERGILRTSGHQTTVCSVSGWRRGQRPCTGSLCKGGIQDMAMPGCLSSTNNRAHIAV